MWLWWTVPIAASAQPMVPGRLILLTREGVPFAEAGYRMDRPVEVAKLPKHVAQAFYAIEDRRFPSHIGIDPIGIGRALYNNLTGGPRQGGSTITQQLAKNAYLRDPETGNPDPGYGRKAREAAIAVWLEMWLTKDQILERYLSMVPFGQDVYGLRAASLHYFRRQPERLTLEQAIMLAGLVQAPSAYDPARNEAKARKRAMRVAEAMQAAGYLPPGRDGLPAIAELDIRRDPPQKTGFYFSDWVMADARAMVGREYAEQRVTTTLDARLQIAAQEAIRALPYDGVEAALVAMRPNGEVVAMIGGRDYSRSQFNRATSGNRQPGSTFKLFTYLAALETGMRHGSLVSNAPITEGDYRPANANGQYGGEINLTQAFASSSNVAAVRLFEEVGPDRVVDMMRRFGITGAVDMNPSLALGTIGASPMAMTAAYAGVAAGKAGVVPYGLQPVTDAQKEDRAAAAQTAEPLEEQAASDMRAMLRAVIDGGTGKAAKLPVPAYGKTGTTQNNRDAWFIGYAGELVVGVWLGNDTGIANPEISGGDAAARLWRDFMLRAIAADRLMIPTAGADPGGEPGRGSNGGSGSGDGGGTAGNGSTLPALPPLRGDDGRTVEIPATGTPFRPVSSTRGIDSSGNGVPRTLDQLEAESRPMPGNAIGVPSSAGFEGGGEEALRRARRELEDISAGQQQPGTPQRLPVPTAQRPPPSTIVQQPQRRSSSRDTGDEDEDFTIDCGNDSC